MDLFSRVSNRGTNWGDLPEELWYAVMEVLNLHDQIRFLCVSKKQLSFAQIQSNNAMNRLPWIFELDEISESNSFTYKLFDPIHEYPYQTLRIQKSRPDYIYSKHGWLFCFKEKPRRECSSSTPTFITEVFLFCPYTKETILLPDLCSHDLLGVKLGCNFSTLNPKSEECEFFVVYYDSVVQTPTTFVIYYCKRDSNTWKNCYAFTISDGIDSLQIRGFEYLEGKLYLIIVRGNPNHARSNCFSFVFICDHHVENDYRFFGVPKYPLFSLVRLENRGSLGIIFPDVFLMKKYSERAYNSLKSFTCNTMKIGAREFEEKKLENCALFLGTDKSGDSPFVVEDLTEEELGVLGNKIFYLENDGVKFYDLCKADRGIQTKYFLLQRDGLDEVEGARKSRKRTWILPPNRVKF